MAKSGHIGSAKQLRTMGDGMDNSLCKMPEAANFSLNTKFTPSVKMLNSLKPVEPTSQIFPMIPKYVPKERKIPKCLVRKPKEPKFVPYEPYKAAVEPIVSNRIKNKVAVSYTKPSKNNVEIHELVQQMSNMRTAEINKATLSALENDDPLMLRSEWEKEREKYEADIKNLRETNAHLENQIKFQTQVNSELKTLLVAAVGEDLETRVQHLTEDKLQLARALLNSANHLTSHQEQTEWLSGQCEVWRSKFLASSLMVEELARWKSALAHKLNELQDAVKALLEERVKIQKFMLKSYTYLANMLNTILKSETQIFLRNGNIFDLMKSSDEIMKSLLHSLHICEDEIKLKERPSKLLQTCAEKNALKVLQNPVSVTNKQDALCNAVMGAAMSLGGEQRFLQYPSAQASCCSHCKGEMQII